MTVCAFIGNANTWVEVEECRSCEVSLAQDLPGATGGYFPSHDTLGRVLACLDPEGFRRCFIRWMEAVAQLTQGEVVAVDGKRLRRSYDRAGGKSALHRVSAWALVNSFVLGQLKTEEKSNEITAIPELLKLLALEGGIVIIDAMGG